MPDQDQINLGAGIVSIGDWVTAGGAGSLTDVGHTKGPAVLTPSKEIYSITSERVQGDLKSRPTKVGYTLQVLIQETGAEHLRIALAQPTANKTGTGNDLTLLVGESSELYHQVTLVTEGPGTTGARTYTFWKCSVLSVESINFGKGEEQLYSVTLKVHEDETLATADKFFKSVDA